MGGGDQDPARNIPGAATKERVLSPIKSVPAGQPVPASDEVQDSFDPQRDGPRIVLDFHRSIVDWVELHRHCSRKVCRRAGRCASPTVACYEEHRDVLRETVLPDVHRAIRERFGWN